MTNFVVLGVQRERRAKERTKTVRLTERLRLFRGRGSSLVASRTEHLRGHSRLLIREKTFMTIGFANHLIDS